MTSPVTVLKLGGALLTDKAASSQLRAAVLGAAVEEISAARKEGLLERLILVHGAGSFGHPQVMHDDLHLGHRGAHQILPLAMTQTNVMRLRLAVLEALTAADIPAWPILPSSFLKAEDGVLAEDPLEKIEGAWGLGLVPVLSGDVVFDAARGFSVVSGDVLAVRAALRFGARRLYFASSVDGVFDRDPLHHEEARRVPRWRLSDPVETGDAGWPDASGAMRGKLRALGAAREAIQRGIEVRIFSMREAGRLTRALRGETDIGTEVVP